MGPLSVYPLVSSVDLYLYSFRDPEPFKRILVFLRTDKLECFNNIPGCTEDEILEEANYFGYENIVSTIMSEKKRRRDEKGITINVGGTFFTSTIGTLCRCSNYSGKNKA